MDNAFNKGLARAAQEVARLASYIGIDCPEGAAIAPTVDTGTVIRAIFDLLEKPADCATKTEEKRCATCGHPTCRMIRGKATGSFDGCWQPKPPPAKGDASPALVTSDQPNLLYSELRVHSRTEGRRVDGLRSEIDHLVSAVSNLQLHVGELMHAATPRKRTRKGKQ